LKFGIQALTSPGMTRTKEKPLLKSAGAWVATHLTAQNQPDHPLKTFMAECSKKVGPTFKGIYGRISLVITNNEEREIVSDEEYLSRSILSPKADVVKGFKPFMPDLGLTDAQARDIIEYLKTEGE